MGKDFLAFHSHHPAWHTACNSVLREGEKR